VGSTKAHSHLVSYDQRTVKRCDVEALGRCDVEALGRPKVGKIMRSTSPSSRVCAREPHPAR
jgi:hypothetical protein